MSKRALGDTGFEPSLSEPAWHKRSRPNLVRVSWHMRRPVFCVVCIGVHVHTLIIYTAVRASSAR